MEQSLIQKIKEGLYLDGLDPKSYSPLSLAYIGDAIYEIVIRTIVMSAGNMSVNKYHKKSSSMVINVEEIPNQVLLQRMHL